MENESACYNVIDIANYFLFKASQGGQELLSNLKLQKLVYYAQGLHLVIYGKPIFDETIEAWTYGPVVPVLYHQYKNYGSQGIPCVENFDPLMIDTDTREFLDEIYDVFGQFSAIRLMEISHMDECWSEAGINNEIKLCAMEKCLKKYLKNG